jgi:hypothetical protein
MISIHPKVVTNKEKLPKISISGVFYYSILFSLSLRIANGRLLPAKAFFPILVYPITKEAAEQLLRGLLCRYPLCRLHASGGSAAPG